jgi:hypothetical protein
VFRGISPQPCQVTAIGQGQQALVVQAPRRGNDVRIGILVHLDALLAGFQIEADQGIQFMDKIRRVGHVKPRSVKCSAKPD